MSLSSGSRILLMWNVVKPEMDLKIPVLLLVSDELPPLELTHKTWEPTQETTASFN